LANKYAICWVVLAVLIEAGGRRCTRELEEEQCRTRSPCPLACMRLELCSTGMNGFGLMEEEPSKRRNARGPGWLYAAVPATGPLPNRGNGSACVAKLISVCVVVASTSRQADTHSHCQRDSSPGCQLWLARHFRLLMVRVVSVEHVQYAPRIDGRYVPAHMPLIYVRTRTPVASDTSYVRARCSFQLSNNLLLCHPFISPLYDATYSTVQLQ
jgi:hypothetical protein